uniref:Uncharacterized protein n=2 Tax=Aegilops tauschii subsp. strangulata TaxID=200361 RepID=A0A452XQL1_AEGTS
MQPCDVDVRDRYRTSHNMVTPLKAVPLPLFLEDTSGLCVGFEAAESNQAR